MVTGPAPSTLSSVMVLVPLWITKLPPGRRAHVHICSVRRGAQSDDQRHRREQRQARNGQCSALRQNWGTAFHGVLLDKGCRVPPQKKQPDPKTSGERSPRLQGGKRQDSIDKNPQPEMRIATPPFVEQGGREIFPDGYPLRHAKNPGCLRQRDAAGLGCRWGVRVRLFPAFRSCEIRTSPGLEAPQAGLAPPAFSSKHCHPWPPQSPCPPVWPEACDIVRRPVCRL